MRHYVQLWLAALFLQREAYEYQRDRRNPFGEGLLFVAAIGFIVALSAIVGAALRYASSPSADAIKNIVLRHLEAMPFFTSIPPAAQEQFTQGYQDTWNMFGSFFAGYPTDTASWVQVLAGVVTTPLMWIVLWLIYGSLVHLAARGANRDIDLGEGLGALALATSPQLIRVVDLFPGAAVSGVVISLWILTCNIFAVRVTYNTTASRAVWSALFPLLLLAILLVIPLILLIGWLTIAGTSVTRGG